jgi:hypothetical protein
VDGGRRSSLAGGVLGLALLGACAGDPSPASLMVGGRLSAAFRDLAREEVQENFRLAPTLASAALAPRALRPLPVPVLRPRLAGALPPPPPPRKPVPDERIAWIPQAKPEPRPAPESPVATRIAIWPPPWKPADLPLAVAPAAGPPEARATRSGRRPGNRIRLTGHSH